MANQQVRQLERPIPALEPLKIREDITVSARGLGLSKPELSFQQVHSYGKTSRTHTVTIPPKSFDKFVLYVLQVKGHWETHAGG